MEVVVDDDDVVGDEDGKEDENVVEAVVVEKEEDMEWYMLVNLFYKEVEVEQMMYNHEDWKVVIAMTSHVLLLPVFLPRPLPFWLDAAWSFSLCSPLLMSPV